MRHAVSVGFERATRFWLSGNGGAKPNPEEYGKFYCVELGRQSPSSKGTSEFGGVAYARFWKWEQSGGKVRITYDNEWGVRVVRSGTVEGDTMSGTAKGPRGREWTWRAERLPARAPGPAPPPR